MKMMTRWRSSNLRAPRAHPPESPVLASISPVLASISPVLASISSVMDAGEARTKGGAMSGRSRRSHGRIVMQAIGDIVGARGADTATKRDTSPTNLFGPPVRS